MKTARRTVIYRLLPTPVYKPAGFGQNMTAMASLLSARISDFFKKKGKYCNKSNFFLFFNIKLRIFSNSNFKKTNLSQFFFGFIFKTPVKYLKV